MPFNIWLNDTEGKKVSVGWNIKSLAEVLELVDDLGGLEQLWRQGSYKFKRNFRIQIEGKPDIVIKEGYVVGASG